MVFGVSSVSSHLGGRGSLFKISVPFNDTLTNNSKNTLYIPSFLSTRFLNYFFKRMVFSVSVCQSVSYMKRERKPLLVFLFHLIEETEV